MLTRVSRPAAIAATAVVAAIIVFQLLLAAGLPLGRFAWGGQHKGVLPTSLRWGSLVAVPILTLAARAVLARANLVAPGGTARVMRIAAWVFTCYFTLNTVINILTKSSSERLLMTPASGALVLCFLIVARS